MKNDKFYVDYDEDTATYCIFDDETGKAHGGYTEEWAAQKDCNEMNHN